MLHIQSSSISNRLKFAADFVFSRVWGQKYLLEANSQIDKKFFIITNPEQSNLQFKIPNSGFCFEKGLNNQIKQGQFEAYPVLFPCGDEDLQADINFDLFAFVFYLLARYEEYLPYEADIHGRFKDEDAWVVKNKVNEIPIIDHLLFYIKPLIENKLSIQLINNQLNEIISLDIDQVNTFKQKGINRQFLSLSRNLIYLRFNDVIQQINILIGLKKDPFFVFDSEYWFKSKKSLIFFWLISDYGKYDKNINWKKKDYLKALNLVMEYAEIGLHPGYNSLEQKENLGVEKSRLHLLSRKEIKKARFHFLRYKLPDSYENLIKEGFESDFTCGFNRKVGFRAGTAYDFKFYNVLNETIHEFKVYPFAYMDVALKLGYGFDAEEAEKKIEDLKNNCKMSGGNFISLWHNESISASLEWKNWDKIFKKQLLNQ